MDEAIRVLLVDDSAPFRVGLRKAFELAPEVIVVGEADDGETALPLIESLKPDVVLLDCRSLPLLKPLGLASPATNYLHIFDGTWLSGCDLYIPADTNLSNLASYSRCGYGNWDNAISSFTIQSGAWVTFYVDTNYGGSSVSYVGPDGLGVMPGGFNDSISSLRVGWVAAPAQ